MSDERWVLMNGDEWNACEAVQGVDTYYDQWLASLAAKWESAAERTPEQIEELAGRMLVEAVRLRVKRGEPADAHEIRHIHAAIVAGNSEECGGGWCVLDEPPGWADGKAVS